MTRRGGAVLAVVLVVLLGGGVALGPAVGGRVVAVAAPLRAPAAVPSTGVGPTEVVLSADALGHPAADLVRAQLQRHFAAINAKDYAAWTATVVPSRSEALPEQAWLEAYDSTRDGSVRVDRIDDLPGARVLVRVRFVSTQDVDDAPPEVPERRICWRSSLPMSGVPPLIEQTGGGSSVAVAC